MDLKEEDALGDRVGEHWYYRAKAAAVRRALAGLEIRRILDVGAGSGFFSKELLRTTPAREAVAVDPNYPRDWSEEAGDKPIRFIRDAGSATADLVLMMDVLEHVEDDLSLLRLYADPAPSDTNFLVTVPAFSFLWSGHDVFLEHKRRYTLDQIEALMHSAGLEVRLGCYFFGLIFPLVACLRLAGRLFNRHEAVHSDLKAHHPLVNALLRRTCELELPVMSRNRAFGLSVFCVARKP